MKCPNCGGDSKGPVCDYCGTQLADTSQPQPAAQTPPQTPAAPPVYPQPPAMSSPPKSRLSHLLAVVVILVVTVSLVSGAFAYMAAPDGALTIDQEVAVAVSGEDDWAPPTEAETGETAVEATEPQAPRLGSRSHPIPLGETGEYNGLDAWLYDYRLELKVTGVKRGQEALDIVKAGSKFNDEPPEGKEYILVQFHVKALDSEDDKKINLDNSLFKFVSAKGVTYNDFVAVLGLETPLTDLYSGGETEGTVYGIVDKDDSPLAVFLEGMDDSVWFSLK